MTFRTGSFLENAADQMDDLLRRICQEVQLSPTRYQEAVNRYQAVCRWLEARDSVVMSYLPTIYAQGSMRIGTTVRPLRREEHDLDFVCELRSPATRSHSPVQLLKLIELRLGQHAAYAGILEVKNRCLRLNYANEFHMDILPGCLDPGSGGGCLLVPDRESQWWKPSNPKGYAEWFERRCDLAHMAEHDRALARAEPIPEQEPSEEKATLKRVVQLLKRWRDIHYEGVPHLAPISMVLTTLAGHAYRGQLSVSECVTGILDSIVHLIESSRPRIYVLNPRNPQEDLSERWDDPNQYASFVHGLREFHEQWKPVTGAKGIHGSASLLERLFGEPVQVALTKQAKEMQELRQHSGLGVGAGGLIALGGRGVRSRPNTFHGKE